MGERIPQHIAWVHGEFRRRFVRRESGAPPSRWRSFRPLPQAGSGLRSFSRLRGGTTGGRDALAGIGSRLAWAAKSPALALRSPPNHNANARASSPCKMEAGMLLACIRPHPPSRAAGPGVSANATSHPFYLLRERIPCPAPSRSVAGHQGRSYRGSCIRVRAPSSQERPRHPWEGGCSVARRTATQQPH